MRDDIHRRLPLSRAWKGVVKACTRDAETALRPTLVEQAAGTELRQLRRPVVDAARRAFEDSRHALFPNDAFHLVVVPTSPIEGSFLRECYALAGSRLEPAEATARALERALTDRVEAIAREVRAHVSIDSPRDCATLIERFSDAARGADLEALARRHLAGEPPPRSRKLPFDLDADLRGSHEP